MLIHSLDNVSLFVVLLLFLSHMVILAYYCVHKIALIMAQIFVHNNVKMEHLPILTAVPVIRNAQNIQCYLLIRELINVYLSVQILYSHLH